MIDKTLALPTTDKTNAQTTQKRMAARAGEGECQERNVTGLLTRGRNSIKSQLGERHGDL